MYKKFNPHFDTMIKGKDNLETYRKDFNTLLSRTDKEGLEKTKLSLMNITESLYEDVKETLGQYQNHKENLNNLMEKADIDNETVDDHLDYMEGLYERLVKNCETLLNQLNKENVSNVFDVGQDVLTKLNTLESKAKETKKLLTELQTRIKSKIHQERERLNTLEKTSQNVTNTVKYFFTDY